METVAGKKKKGNVYNVGLRQNFNRMNVALQKLMFTHMDVELVRITLNKILFTVTLGKVDI